MKEFPKDIKFKYEWRRYQQRVLDDLEEQLDDNHLHIIAPPGSGKTVLGLEVAIRLNKPTLIFAPTISIRNQWIQRFCELFLLVGDDIQLLKRRFKSFVGISNETETTIENGINRIHLPEVFGSAELQSFNKEIIKKAGQRDQLKQKWKDALLNGSSLIEQIKVPFPEGKEYKKTMSLYYHKTIANMIAMLVSAIFGFLESIFNGLGRSIRYIKSREDLLQYLMYIGILGVIIFGRQTYKTIRLYFKYRDISKDIQQIGEALLESLIKTGTINTEYSKLEVIASLNDFGSIYCHLKGGTSYEKSTFIKSLHEIIAAVDNPRYLIIRKSLFLKIISQKDYHAVPEIIGRNKKTAEYFERQWKRLVGSCELIYSRTIEGRKILLQSRINSLSSEFEDKTERINKWR
ncbi:DEAD/DEAH box helicase family protein [Lentimicrobium sp. S6]|uniref:DEAD/DEAH box helicase family protein n=1 Tax=Lentimicrobium sp. S6 TaxID=2735872 RepID=UPI001555D52E|nr:DEAD/DEAH box helicase family protein [Lentimicrobium sp. S6]NPD46918.1 DEAD/DEAH box helicase family protein [Lentimicrobium sp. S6]